MSNTKDITIKNVDLDLLEKQLNTLIEVQIRLKNDLIHFISDEDAEELLKEDIEGIEGLINFIGEIVAPSVVNSPASQSK
jgi:hypothetical protein